MCGINGFITLEKKDPQDLVPEINYMNDLIFHRGPDDDGVFVEQAEGFAVALGMRRLSIIDLHSGKQPIFSDDKELVIVFNGEIYNYRDLKEHLQKQGVNFRTSSDTEVILKMYENEGEASFGKLDGMFAFSIYDKRKNKVFIVRDFFGEKPLYYTQTDNMFIWGSELKAVIYKLQKKPSISVEGLNLFFRLTYTPAPYTIYDGIFKLEPNHYLVYDLDKKNYSKHAVDEELIPEQKSKIGLEQAKKEVKDLVFQSVVSRSVADVPIGTFLSGGVDSSIVSLCLAQYKSNPIDTFSIGFEKKSYDETDKSRVVAKQINSKHHEFIIGEKDIEKNLDEILLNFDEPFADSSSLPTYIVSNKTADFVKVALTGDGGDEVFGGYNKYYIGKMNKKYTRIVPRIAHNLLLKSSSLFLRDSNDKRGTRYKIDRFLNSIDYDGQYYWDIISLGYTKNSLHRYLLPSYLKSDIFDWYIDKTKIDRPSSITDFRVIDRNISLEGDMLVKVDRTSMLNSLECRAPFLNKKIWDYANQLPENYLMNGWDKKFILKEAFKDQFPEGFLDKSKSGFGVPVGDWLRSSLKKELQGYTEKNKLLAQQIFDVEEIQQLVSNHISGKADNTFKVWTFYCFQKWYFNNYLPK